VAHTDTLNDSCATVLTLTWLKKLPTSLGLLRCLLSLNLRLILRNVGIYLRDYEASTCRTTISRLEHGVSVKLLLWVNHQGIVWINLSHETSFMQLPLCMTHLSLITHKVLQDSHKNILRISHFPQNAT
jgi:hypothetical protein